MKLFELFGDACGLAILFGGLPVTRDMLTQILSRAEVTAIEETAAGALLDKGMTT